MRWWREPERRVKSCRQNEEQNEEVEEVLKERYYGSARALLDREKTRLRCELLGEETA